MTATTATNEVYSLLHPLKSVRDVTHCKVGETVESVFQALHLPTFFPILAYVNGDVVDERDWASTILREGQLLIFKAIPQGGDDGNKILRMAIMIAAVVVGQYWIMGALPATATLTEVIIATTLSAALVAGASFAANALFPPTVAKPPDFSGETEQRWSIAGSRNVMSPGRIIPQLLGKFRMYPHHAAPPYTELVGQDQYVRMLFTFGHGPIKLASIDDLKLGETKLTEYSSVEYEYYEGGAADESPTHYLYEDGGTPAEHQADDGTASLYVNNVTETSVGQKLLYRAPGPYTTATTQHNAHEFIVDLTYPQGIIRYGSDGSRQRLETSFDVQWRKTDTTGKWFTKNGPNPGDVNDTANAGELTAGFFNGKNRLTIADALSGLLGGFMDDRYKIGWRYRLAGFSNGVNNVIFRVTGIVLTDGVPLELEVVTLTGVNFANETATGAVTITGNDHRYRRSSSVMFRKGLRVKPSDAGVTGSQYDVRLSKHNFAPRNTREEIFLDRDQPKSVGGYGAHEDSYTRYFDDVYFSTLRSITHTMDENGDVATATVTFNGEPSISETITIMSTDGTSRTYTAKNSSNIAVGQFKRTGTVTQVAGRLKSCIEHANGHAGKITIVQDDGELALTQVEQGVSGNHPIVNGLTNVVKTDFDVGSDGNTVPPVFTDNLSKLAIRIKATDQLNGTPNNLNAVVQTKVDVWNGSAWTTGLENKVASSNPAAILRHMLTGDANSNAILPARINDAAMGAWYAETDTAGRNCNIIYNSNGTLFSRLQEVAGVGRASFGMVEGEFSVVRELAVGAPIIQHFTPRNSSGFSANKKFVERTHGLKIQFNNEDEGYFEDEDIVYDDKIPEDYTDNIVSFTTAACAADETDGVYKFAMSGGSFNNKKMFDVGNALRISGFTTAANNGECVVATKPNSTTITVTGLTLVDEVEGDTITFQAIWGVGDATKFETLPLKGVTSSDQAWKMGRYYMAVSRLRPETYSITTDFENLIVNRGDMVRVTHDVPLLGVQSGRIKAVTIDTGPTPDVITHITVDEEMVMEAGKSYAVRIRLAHGTPDGTASAYHLVENPVSSGSAAQTTLEFSDSVDIPSAPALAGIAEGDLVMFGEAGKESGEFIVAGIEPGADLTATLALLDASIDGINGADTGTIPPFATNITLPSETGFQSQPPPEIVAGDFRSGYETSLTPGDGSVEDGVSGAFQLSQLFVAVRPPPYQVADFIPHRYRGQIRESDDVGEESVLHDDSEWRTTASTPVGTPELIFTGVVPGVTYDVRVQVADAIGNSSTWALVENYTVTGDQTFPLAPINLVVEGEWLKWEYPVSEVEEVGDPAVPASDIHGYKVRYNSDTNAEWTTADNVKAHEGVVTDMRFNVRDLLIPGASNTLTRKFFVKAVDTSGNMSRARDRFENTSSDKNTGAATLVFTYTDVLAIASSKVVPTRDVHKIDVEGLVASTDDLIEITPTNFQVNDKLSISAANGARDIVIKHGANGTDDGGIDLFDGKDFTLEATGFSLNLILTYNAAIPALIWREQSRGLLSSPAPSTIDVYDDGDTPTSYMVINPTQISHELNIQGPLSSVILQKIGLDNLTSGTVIRLSPKQVGEVITFEHGAASDGFLVNASGTDFRLFKPHHVAFYLHEGTYWKEISHTTGDDSGLGLPTVDGNGAFTPEERDNQIATSSSAVVLKNATATNLTDGDRLTLYTTSALNSLTITNENGGDGEFVTHHGQSIILNDPSQRVHFTLRSGDWLEDASTVNVFDVVSNLTIADGQVTPVLSVHTVDPATGTADTIHALGVGSLLDGSSVTLRPRDAGDEITITHSAKGARQFTAANAECFLGSDSPELSQGDRSFAFSLWVYFDSLTGNTDILRKWDGTDNQRSFDLVQDENSGVEKLLWLVSGDGTTNTDTLVWSSPSNPIEVGKWFHVYVEHDHSANTIGIAVNNGSLSTAAHTTGVYDSIVPFTLGHTSSGNTHDGRMSRLGYWKGRILLAAERTWLYNSGVGRPYAEYGQATGDGSALKTNLISAWDLDESVLTTNQTDAIDSHAKNHLTDTGTVMGAEGPEPGLIHLADGVDSVLRGADDSLTLMKTGNFWKQTASTAALISQPEKSVTIASGNVVPTSGKLLVSPEGYLAPTSMHRAGGTLWGNGARTFTLANAEYLEADNGVIIPGTSDFALAFWFRLTTLTPSGEVQTIIRNGSDTVSQAGIRIDIPDNNKLQVSICNAHRRLVIDSNISISVNAWYFIVINWIRAANQEIHVNNTSVTLTDMAGDHPNSGLYGAFATSDSNLRVGCSATGGGGDDDPFGGQVTRMAYWTRKLTPDERVFLHNSTKGRVYAEYTDSLKESLVSAWDMDEISGSSLDAHGSNDLADNETVTFTDGPSLRPVGDNNRVQQWDSSEGNNVYASQGTSAKQPILKTGILNSLPVVRFDGVDDYLVTSLVGPAMSTEFIVAAKRNTNADATLYGTNSQRVLKLQSTAIGKFDQPDGGGSATFDTIGAIGEMDFHIYTLIRNAQPGSGGLPNWLQPRIDGTPDEAFAPKDINTTVYALAARDLNGGNAGQIDIAEFITFTNPLTAILSSADYERVEGYLAHKYGLEGSLPASHPYKSTDPGSPFGFEGESDTLDTISLGDFKEGSRIIVRSGGTINLTNEHANLGRLYLAGGKDTVLNGGSGEALELMRTSTGWQEVGKTLGVGTADNDLVQLDAVGLPPVSGEQLTRVYARLPRCSVLHVYEGQDESNTLDDTSSGAYEFYRAFTGSFPSGSGNSTYVSPDGNSANSGKAVYGWWHQRPLTEVHEFNADYPTGVSLVNNSGEPINGAPGIYARMLFGIAGTFKVQWWMNFQREHQCATRLLRHNANPALNEELLLGSTCRSYSSQATSASIGSGWISVAAGDQISLQFIMSMNAGTNDLADWLGKAIERTVDGGTTYVRALHGQIDLVKEI